VGPIGVSQKGRWVVAANSHEDEVYAIDVAINRIRHRLEVERKPYQVAFSTHFVYVRSMGSERVSMFEINHLNTMDKVPVSSFAAGTHAPSKTTDLSLASAITQAPGEAAVLVTSPSDKTVYYYMEGMNAPMGNFRNYGHSPRAVQVADRTLREEEGGVYTAKVRVPAAGTYDVAFVMESPNILHCFEMAAERDPLLHLEDAARLEFLDITRKVTIDDDVTVKFRVIDPNTGDNISGLKDVRVHYYRAPSFDRRMAPATEVGDGVYKLDTKLSKPGVYYFFVGSKTARLNMNEASFLSMQASRPAATN